MALKEYNKPRIKERKIKHVTRTYYSKKLGQNVTKTYDYNPFKYKQNTHKYDYKTQFEKSKNPTEELKEARGIPLVLKSGKTTKAYENYLKQQAKLTGKKSSDLKEIVNSYISKEKYKTIGKLYLNTALRMIGGVKLEKALANFGYSPEELAVELGAKYNEEITPDYILNPSNWNGTTLTLPNGEQVNFEYDYHGGVLYNDKA